MTETVAPATDAASTWRDRLRSEPGYLLELVALVSFVVAQPVLDVFGKSPETFLSEGASRTAIVAFLLVVALVPIVVLAIVDVVARVASERVHRIVHVAIVALLVGMIAVPIARDATSWSHRRLAAVGIVVAAGAALLYLRFKPVHLFLRYAAIAPLVFVFLFLVASPSSSLVIGSGDHVDQVTPERGAPSIVFLMLDELPLTSLLDGNGHIDASLFPNFARLAATSTWYRNDTTVAPYTDAAVPALLSGELPKTVEPVPPTSDRHPRNLFTMLGKSYVLHVSEPVTRLCPDRLCGANVDAGALNRLLHQAASIVYDRSHPYRTPHGQAFAFMQGSRLGRDRVDEFANFIDDIQPVAPGRRPRLDYAHVMLPHPPWVFTAQPTQTNEPEGPAVGIVSVPWGSTYTAELARRRHLLQLQALDRQIGHLLDRLHDTGRDRNSLLIVTSDHGNGFVSGEPFRGIGEQNEEQVAWVPLFVRRPGQTNGSVDERNAWQTDVLPTIADAIGTKVPWKTEGSSLFGPERRAPDDKIVLDWTSSELHPKSGKFLHIRARSGYAQVLRYRLAGDADDPARVYRIAPYGDLVGRRVADLDVGAPATFRMQLEAPDQYHAVDLRTLAPIYVHATADALNDDARRDFWAAVAVNGRIAGTGQNVTQYAGDPLGVHALVAPQYLHDGDNDVRLYLVEGRPGAATLRPLTP